LFQGFRNATSFVTLTEFTTEKRRALLGVASFYFWVAALLVLPLIGYLVREWRYFLLVTAFFAIPCLFTWWYVDFSLKFHRKRYTHYFNNKTYYSFLIRW
jgi:MFS family permease